MYSGQPSGKTGGWTTTSRVGVLALLLLVAGYLGCTLTGGWDIWWHMLVGRVAVAEGSLLSQDIFSHTMAGVPWSHKDLVAAVVLWAGFEKLGFVWFAILKGLVVVAVALCVHFSVVRANRRPEISILTAGLAIAAIQYRLVERPLLFSLALFPLLFMLLERVRTHEGDATVRKMMRLWFPILCISWLWLLLHRGGLVGLGLILAYVRDAWAGVMLGRGVGRRLFVSRHTGAAIGATVALLGAVALSFATPSGYHLHFSSLAVAGSDALRTVISDWVPIGPYELLVDFPVTAALAFCAFVVGAIAVLSNRDGDRYRPGLMHLGLVAFFLLLTLGDSVRWVPYLSIASAITLGISLISVLQRIRKSSRGLLVRARGWSVLAGVGILSLIVANNNFGTGVGPMAGRYPDQTIAFAQKSGLAGKVINSFHLGGYLMWKMWPDVTVSLDGRNDLIFPPAVLLDGLKAQKDPREFAKLSRASGANWVMGSNVPGRLNYQFLFTDPDWTMVHWSDPSVIYVRNSAYPDMVREGFRYVAPGAVDTSVVHHMTASPRDPKDITGVEREVQLMLKSSPDSLRANVAAALLFHFKGRENWSRRDEILRRIEELDTGGTWSEDLRARFGSLN